MLPTSYNKVASILEDNDQESSSSLGRAAPKQLVDLLDSISVATSLICLILAALVVSPTFGWAWALGYDNQIIVIGFVLSIMNLCLRRVAPMLFLILEAKWGKSILQHYDAIIRNQVFASHISLLWRLVLLAFLALPIALSVAYKRSTMGLSSLQLTETSNHYGLVGPPGLNNFGYNTGLSLMANATQSFLVASASDNTSVSTLKYPVAYGFNNLLLSSTSAAFLDAPMEDFVSRTQSTVRTTEYIDVTASVNATVSEIQPISAQDRRSSTFWSQYYNNSRVAILQTNKLWNSYDIGLLINNRYSTDTSWCFVGLFPTNVTSPGFWDQTAQESLNFQQTAKRFSTHRERCKGTWRITSTSIQLLAGECAGEHTVQDIFTSAHTRTWTSVYITMLSELLGQFSVLRNESSWQDPSFTNAVAAMYWSRFVAGDGYYAPRDTSASGFTAYTMTKKQQDEIYYPVKDHIISTRKTLKADWLLYLVLAIQPLLVLAIYTWTILNFHIPIDRDFGIVTLLAGAERSSLEKLDGATLSGRLVRPVPIRIVVQGGNSNVGEGEEIELSDSLGSHHARLKYEIDVPNGDMGRLRKRVVYR